MSCYGYGCGRLCSPVHAHRPHAEKHRLYYCYIGDTVSNKNTSEQADELEVGAVVDQAAAEALSQPGSLFNMEGGLGWGACGAIHGETSQGFDIVPIAQMLLSLIHI
eukprot:5305875-Alexandrium_andersonii.AAC.1